jgi:hypothetical protein
MKRTFVYIDGEFVEKKRDEKGRYHYLFPEFKPYKSMIDGRTIESREQHRRHLKVNGCIEVGNEDPLKHGPKGKPKNKRVEVLRHQLANMTHSDANRLLSRLRDDLRFTHNPHRNR